MCSNDYCDNNYVKFNHIITNLKSLEKSLWYVSHRIKLNIIIIVIITVIIEITIINIRYIECLVISI